MMGLKDFKLQGEQTIYSSSNINFDGVFYCEGHVKQKKSCRKESTGRTVEFVGEGHRPRIQTYWFLWEHMYLVHKLYYHHIRK